MGFDSISDYACGSFNSIKGRLISDREQDNYYQKWMRNYSKLFKRNNSFEIIEWKVREWRAIKEIYASAIFYAESKIALKNRCMASYYFLLYYSLFHAMLSSICLDNTITLEQIKDINHSKVGNQFRNTYCHCKDSILSDDIYYLFNKFKYLREYYSYTPPLNMSLYDDSYEKKLKDTIIKCYQTTNLQSLILEKSYFKHCKSIKIDSFEKNRHLKKSFLKLVSKPSIDDNAEYVLDDADINTMNEIIQYGVEFRSIGLQLDHTLDEFRGYNESSEFFDEADGIESLSIYGFIYDSIMYDSIDIINRK